MAEHSPDQELRQLYADLLSSEARHFGIYWSLAEERWPRAEIVERLEELAEAEVLALQGNLAQLEDVRMHSVGVSKSR